LTSFNSINVIRVEEFHEKPIYDKAIEAISDLLRTQASKPYNSTGTHFLLISCNTTSSEAILPILPKMLFAAR